MIALERDWRREYLICRHVAANPDLELRAHRFRVCCVPCARECDADGLSRMLNEPEIATERVGGFVVFSLPESST